MLLQSNIGILTEEEIIKKRPVINWYTLYIFLFCLSLVLISGVMIQDFFLSIVGR